MTRKYSLITQSNQKPLILQKSVAQPLKNPNLLWSQNAFLYFKILGKVQFNHH